MVPGLTCIDLFAQRFVPRLASGPLHVVALPPGHANDDARATLMRGASVEDLGVVDSCAAVLAAVAERVGAEEAAAIDDLVLRNVDRLRWPRLLLGTVSPGGDVDAVIDAAERLAEVTRNLEGPLRFVLLLEAGTRWPRRAQPLVWEPQFGVPHPLPFHEPSRSVRDAGFDTFLACRVYWEAAGQPTYLQALSDALRVTELMVARDADERLDRALDERWAGLCGPPHAILAAFAAAYSGADARAVLRTGILAAPLRPIAELEAAGLCWRPPGSLHALLTPLAAYQLARSPRIALNDAERVHLRRKARHNQMLGAWVLQLTGHVERELLWRCQRQGGVDARLAQLGLTQRLRDEQARSQPAFAYCPSEDLLDYASFRDLIDINDLGEVKQNMSQPSTKQLSNIRHARNLSAHLHPVTWRAVDSVLSVLHQLAR